MTTRVILALLLLVGAGCAASRRSSTPLAGSGLVGRWETPKAVDNGAPIGMALVRLDIQPDGTWHQEWKRPDGVPATSASGEWGLANSKIGVLRNGPEYRPQCAIELLDAHTLRIGDSRAPVFELKRVE